MTKEDLMMKLSEEVGVRTPNLICLTLENTETLAQLGLTADDDQVVEELHTEQSKLIEGIA
jgi:hypothetical protein